MTMFKRLLAEAAEELDVPATDITATADAIAPTADEEVKTDEDTEESAEGEAKEGTVQKDVQDIITSILDAVEAESLASGEVFNDDESVDIGLELIYKIAPKLDDKDAKLIYDELSEYFQMEVEEGADKGEDDEFFEEPKTDEGVIPIPAVPAVAVGVTESKKK